MLTELVEELKTRDDNTKRVIFDFRDLKFGYDEEKKENSLVKGDDKFLLTDNGFESLAKVLDIPVTYLNKTPTQLRELTVNWWLQNKNASYSMLAEENSVRGFMNPAYCYIPTGRVFEAATQDIEDLSIGNYNISADAVELVAFSEPFKTNVVDSEVRAGIRFLHSDSWNIFPRFDAYLCRIACMNSTIAPLGHKKFRVSNKTETEVLAEVRGFVKESLEQIPLMLVGYEELAKDIVENLVGVITNICQKNKIPQKIKSILIETSRSPLFLATISDASVKNMYDLVNLFTYVASHIDGAQSHKELLFSIAGQLMLTHSDHCVTCGNVVH